MLSLFLVFLLFLNPPLASIILSHSSLINWLDGRLWYLISLVLLAFGQCTSHLYTIFSNYTINGLDKLKFATESSKTQFSGRKNWRFSFRSEKFEERIYVSNVFSYPLSRFRLENLKEFVLAKISQKLISIPLTKSRFNR